MFSFFSPYPFLRILALWILGILIHREIYFAFLLPFLILEWKWRSWVLCFIVAIAFIRAEQLSPSAPSGNLPHHAFVVQIHHKPIQGPNAFRIQADILAIRADNQWQTYHSRCMLFVDPQAPRMHVGQRYLVTDSLRAIRPPILPNAFDWHEFYASQGIFYSNFVQRKNFILLQDSPENESFVDYLRNRAKAYLHQALPAGVHRDVADAMFLGISNGLDFETRQSYASLGAIHILSVSGLHVGFLFLGLQFLFGFIRKFRTWGGALFFAFMLVILWTYAAMTGFSAPVLRSVWMFSVLLFAQVFRQRLHPLNSWAFACFVLLVFQPSELFQVGFQLSFAAVLGLILFQKRLLQIWKPKFWLSKQIWELTCVAISAQILSAPLIIYYFHQFPNPLYFFLLNPLLVFLSSITLALGFLYLFSAPFAVFNFLGVLLFFSFEILHGLMFSTTQYFMTVIPFIRMHGFELAACYVFIGLVWYWWKYRSLACLYATIVLTVLLSISRLMESPRHEAFLTSVGGEPIFLWVEGLRAGFKGSASPAWVQANVSGWWASRQVVDTSGTKWPKGSFSWDYLDHQFVYLNQPSERKGKFTKSHLILSSTIDLRDMRFLKSWQSATWYFIRKPSAYRLRKMKEYWPKQVVYLSQQPAVHFP